MVYRRCVLLCTVYVVCVMRILEVYAEVGCKDKCGVVLRRWLLTLIGEGPCPVSCCPRYKELALRGGGRCNVERAE